MLSFLLLDILTSRAWALHFAFSRLERTYRYSLPH